MHLRRTFRLNFPYLPIARALFLGLIVFVIIFSAIYTILITSSLKKLVEIVESESEVVALEGDKETAIIVGYGEDVINLRNTNIHNDTMVFASVIFRHGNCSDRNPIPLRINGIETLYKTGQFFRRRYNELLGDYDANDTIYVLSTNTLRAIVSAQALLSGMFPTSDDDKLDQIIHALPDEMDIFFRGGKLCPKYDVQYDWYMEKSPEAVALWKQYGHLIKYWAKMDGMPETIADVADLYRRIQYRKTLNALLDWEEEALDPDGPMVHIKNVVTKLRGTPELVRRRAGFLLKEILGLSGRKINKSLHPDRLLYMFSAHSSTILPILNGFGINELDLPTHGSSLHFEVYRNDENEHYLQFFYRKQGVEHPLPLNVPGCGEKWTLSQFYSTHGEIIPGDFNSECEL